MRWMIGFLAMLAGSMPAAASECFQMAGRDVPLLHRAAETATLATEEVAIRFVGHSSYLLENAEGLRIATDWSGPSAYLDSEVGWPVGHRLVDVSAEGVLDLRVVDASGAVLLVADSSGPLTLVGAGGEIFLVLSAPSSRTCDVPYTVSVP